MTAQRERHIISVKVDNEAGVLEKVAGIFSARGYNIDSLTVAEVDPESAISRITLTVSEPEELIGHIINLLERIVPVHEAKHLTADNRFVSRALLLVKVMVEKDKREEVMSVAHTFHAKEVDISEHSITFELTDIPAKLNEFVDVLKSYGTLGMARTGITAITRGDEPF